METGRENHPDRNYSGTIRGPLIVVTALGILALAGAGLWIRFRQADSHRDAGGCDCRTGQKSEKAAISCSADAEDPAFLNGRK